LEGVAIEVRVAVRGPGVAEGDRGRIFDPFFTTKEPGKGTGLGLSISRTLVEAYGGTLELAASEAGATFVVRLLIWRG
jgi:signal transduction histidine kinase